MMKNLEATKTNFFAKNVRFCQSFWKQRLIIWMTTLAQKFNFCYSMMNSMIADVANRVQKVRPKPIQQV